jgi:nucleoside-diphosphate-sugar epimerase
MSRVLVTGGAGTLGCSIVRRLLSDPAYDVRVSDARAVPQWMRESCELHSGDLRVPAQARAATKGCAHVIHLAMLGGGVAVARAQPHTTIEFEDALHGAVVRAAIERELERFVYVSSPLVFERAALFPTPEAHLEECPPPRSAPGYARLSGERYCEAASEEHGLPYTICRPFGAYGPPATDEPEAETEALIAGLIDAALDGRTPEPRVAEQRTCTPTHVDDLAAGIVLALGSQSVLNDDLNLGAGRELALGELVRLVWEACGAAPAKLAPKRRSAANEPNAPGQAQDGRSWPDVEKARELIGWHAAIDVEAGVAATVQAMRERLAQRATTALPVA